MDILDIFLEILLKPPQPLMGLFLLFAKTTGFSLLSGARPVYTKWPSCSLYIVIMLPSKQSITVEPCDMLNTGVGKPSFEVSALLVLAFLLVWFSLFSTSSLWDHLLKKGLPTGFLLDCQG